MSHDIIRGKADGEVPLHWLSQNYTKLWLLGGVYRASIVRILAREYTSGCGVLSATCRLIAYIDPKGGVRELAPPHRRYQIWQIANQPKAPKCPCADWYYPECDGPWSLMGRRDHHPMCQYDRTSTRVFERAGTALYSRPDAWERAREEEKKRL